MPPRIFTTIAAAAAVALSCCQLSAADETRQGYVTIRGPSEVEQDGVHNVHVDYHGDVNGELSIVYGACGMSSMAEAHHQVGRTHVGSHPSAKRHVGWEGRRPTRFVWVTPSRVSPGCLHAYVDGEPRGRSGEELAVKERRRPTRRATFADVADPMGPWFDGVAYLRQKQPDDAFVAATKDRRFGILGAGISGLLTSLLLDSVGIHNWKIIESSDRLGGRMRTTYLNGTGPADHQYHELGPMRFPTSITDPDTNETFPIMDQRMVFQLADVLNTINAGNDSLQINFIPWIQTSANTPVTTSRRRPDGTFPGRTEVAENPAYFENTTYSNATAVAAASAALDDVKGLTAERIRFYATDVFRAHKQAVEEGLFDFSEVGYLRHVVHADANVTDEVTSTGVAWPMWEYETVYFLADTWRTIEGGLSRMPAAFENIVRGRVLYGSKVHGVAYDDADGGTVTVSHRPTGSDPRAVPSRAEVFDHVFNAVPLNLQRFWELPPYSSLLRRAIDRTVFDGAVKVAIQYSTRFWEHLEHPIHGGCGRVTGSPLVGQVCYPSWDVNGTGPGVLLASYVSSSDATAACAMSDAEHVAYVQRAMVEIHGPAAEEAWTGNWERHCWEHDEHHAGAWAVPVVPQQQLYLPAYWQTEFNTVFIGEHTSYTHSWVFSALESAVRGTVQMLLDLGLVDEAKQITQTWMARWIKV